MENNNHGQPSSPSAAIKSREPKTFRQKLRFSYLIVAGILLCGMGLESVRVEITDFASRIEVRLHPKVLDHSSANSDDRADECVPGAIGNWMICSTSEGSENLGFRVCSPTRQWGRCHPYECSPGNHMNTVYVVGSPPAGPVTCGKDHHWELRVDEIRQAPEVCDRVVDSNCDPAPDLISDCLPGQAQLCGSNVGKR